MTPDQIQALEQTYRVHPLRAETILQRLQSAGRDLHALTERDLATDPASGITDQNHQGGRRAVIELARAIDLGGGEQVLDIGTGLGGTPRVLAENFDCACHGIELTPERYRDACLLTQLVGLQDQVTIDQGEFLSFDALADSYDAIVAQGTLMHFPDPGAVLRKSAECSRSGSWLAIEDGFLRRMPRTPGEARQLEAAAVFSNGRFPTVAGWRDAITDAGFSIVSLVDQSRPALTELGRKIAHADRTPGHIPSGELAGWIVRQQLIADGIVGMIRIVARRL